MADFIDNSEEIIKEMNKRKELALKAIGETAERHAKDITPVDTGRLRNSIANEVEGDSVYIGTNVEYGPAIELGSRGTGGGVHMLKRAATEHVEEYKALVKQALDRG